MYLTYDEYKKYGGTLDESAFNRLVFDAQKHVDAQTHKRISYKPSEAVKRCVARLIDIFQKIGCEEVSFSHDGLSQNIKNPSDSEIIAEANRIIYNYLIHETDSTGTPLLYRGVNKHV